MATPLYIMNSGVDVTLPVVPFQIMASGSTSPAEPSSILGAMTAYCPLGWVFIREAEDVKDWDFSGRWTISLAWKVVRVGRLDFGKMEREYLVEKDGSSPKNWGTASP